MVNGVQSRRSLRSVGSSTIANAPIGAPFRAQYREWECVPGRVVVDIENAPVMMQLMTTNELLSAIDEEISRLKQVKTLLIGEAGAKARTAFSFGANRPRRKRALSVAAKAKIRAAQKKRWAEWHKTHPKK